MRGREQAQPRGCVKKIGVHHIERLQFRAAYPVRTGGVAASRNEDDLLLAQRFAGVLRIFDGRMGKGNIQCGLQQQANQLSGMGEPYLDGAAGIFPCKAVYLCAKAHVVIGVGTADQKMRCILGTPFESFRRLLPKVQHLLGIGAERPALAGQRHAAAAVKQRLSQFLFKLKYALAHGGLGDNKPLRTAGEILRFRQSKKGFKLFRVHGRPLRFLYGIETIRIIRFIYCTKRGRIVNRNTCGTKERITCC